MKIHLNKMVFYGYHGVYPEEQKLGQRFWVNLTLFTDDKLDCQIKHLEDTIDYTLVYAELKSLMEEKSFILLENCANAVIERLFELHGTLTGVNIKISKPSVPIKGTLESVEVEMERFK